MKGKTEFVPSHRKLEAWKSAMELVKGIYMVTRHFPSDERFGLTSQLRRASVSVPANIAEGAASVSDREYLRFLGIARKSLMEVDTELVIAIELEYLEGTDEVFNTWKETSYLLDGLIKYLRRCVG